MTEKEPKLMSDVELKASTQKILNYCLNKKDNLKKHQIKKWTLDQLRRNHEILNLSTQLFEGVDQKRVKSLKLFLKELLVIPADKEDLQENVA